MKCRARRRFGIAAALLLVSASLPAQQVFVTRDGALRAVIVYPRELSTRMDQAVAEFRRCIREMSGAVVPLRRDPDPAFNTLHLGIQESGDSIPDARALSALNQEGFIIRVTDGEAWLCGRTELGLQHALYWLLEQWGCRWLFPGPAGEVVPHSPTLLLDRSMETDQQPHFLMRALWYNYGSHLPEGPKRDLLLWTKRNRLEHSFYGGIGHAYRRIVSHRDRGLFSAHPEYYPRLFGFRVRRGQICTGNEGVRERAVRYAMDYFRQHPEQAIVSLSPNDGAGPWRCPENRKYRSFTDAALDLANHVAEALARNPETSDKLVAMYAYLDTSPPPTIRARDNVIVFIATRLGVSPWRWRIRAWAEKTTRLGIQDYASILPFHWTRPVWRLEALQRSVQIWREHGVEAVNVESGNDWGGWGLYHYVLGRLLWDPDENVEEIFEDFLDKGFGRAARPMRKYFTIWRCGYSEWKLEPAERAVREALRARVPPKTRHRIQLYAQYLRYLRLLAAYQKARHGPERTRALRELVEAGRRIVPTNMAHSGPLIGRFLPEY